MHLHSINFSRLFFGLIIFSSLVNCSQENTVKRAKPTLIEEARPRLDIYQEVALTADLSHLSTNQKDALRLLIEASKIMDDIFWQQAFHQNKKEFLASLSDPKIKKFALINYGPWDRLNNEQPFLSGYSTKALGAQFYPADIDKTAFEQTQLANEKDLYSIVKQHNNGQFYTMPYSEIYNDELNRAAAILDKAANLVEDIQFAEYLKLRAKALKTDEYQLSDLAWMEMKNNAIDLVIGPIESYEDRLYGYRTAFEAYVLIKDKAWSEKLTKLTAFLPKLQKELPVAKKYKAQLPGTNADLNVYDVIYYAGHANAGSKTIAINLPNDEEVQRLKGTRRLQLKNAMQAKFDHILVPIANELIVPEQRKDITFTAFFDNVMFHEIAHGLGINTVIKTGEPVRQALKEHAAALEEGKADVLGLYMISQLLASGDINEATLAQYYTTFLAGIFRSVRFGASSAHGKANMIRFNYFAEQGAFTRTEQGLYRVNIENMSTAVKSLSKLILTLQGDGDYSAVAQLVKEKGVIKAELQADLLRLSSANIPVDITFKQGKDVLGLN